MGIQKSMTPSHIFILLNMIPQDRVLLESLRRIWCLGLCKGGNGIRILNWALLTKSSTFCLVIYLNKTYRYRLFLDIIDERFGDPKYFEGESMGRGWSYSIVDSTRFLTISYISTIKFYPISTSSKTYISNTLKINTIDASIISCFTF